MGNTDLEVQIDRFLQCIVDRDAAVAQEVLYEDYAFVHRVHMRATVLGQDRSGLFVISDVWRRRDGTWRVWRRHSTPLSAGEMPGA